MAERAILFNTEMVKAIQDGRKKRRRLYVCKGEDCLSPEHLAKRLANGLDAAEKDACWEWERTTNQYGYGTLTVSGKTALAHRLAYELAVGPISEGLQVLHKCDNPGCINPDHLYVGTRFDNMRDCYLRGRSKIKPQSFPGSKNPAAKLTKADVAKIRKLLSEGERQHIIAKMFGISQSQVSSIKRGVNWVETNSLFNSNG